MDPEQSQRIVAALESEETRILSALDDDAKPQPIAIGKAVLRTVFAIVRVFVKEGVE